MLFLPTLCIGVGFRMRSLQIGPTLSTVPTVTVPSRFLGAWALLLLCTALGAVTRVDRISLLTPSRMVVIMIRMVVVAMVMAVATSTAKFVRDRGGMLL